MSQTTKEEEYTGILNDGRMSDIANVQEYRPWKLYKERLRKERIDRMAQDIIDSEVAKLIEEAYR